MALAFIKLSRKGVHDENKIVISLLSLSLSLSLLLSLSLFSFPFTLASASLSHRLSNPCISKLTCTELLGRSFEEIQQFFRVVLPRTYATDALAEQVIKTATSIKVCGSWWLRFHSLSFSLFLFLLPPSPHYFNLPDMFLFPLFFNFFSQISSKKLQQYEQEYYVQKAQEADENEDPQKVSLLTQSSSCAHPPPRLPSP